MKALPEKLGLRSDSKSCFLNAPADYLLEMGIDPQFKAQQHLRPRTYFVHFFTTTQEEMKREISRLKGALTLNGMLWISWPKKSSSLETDLNDVVVRKIGLSTGLVDVKIASIDNNWSAMKFMYKLKDRQGLATD